MPPIAMSAVSGGVVPPIAASIAGGGFAACASEFPWTVLGADPARSPELGPPASSGSLCKGENVTTKNTKHEERYLGTVVYPSRMPKDSGFFLLVRFVDKTDPLPDRRFAPTTGAFMSFVEMAGLSAGCS